MDEMHRSDDHRRDAVRRRRFRFAGRSKRGGGGEGAVLSLRLSAPPTSESQPLAGYQNGKKISCERPLPPNGSVYWVACLRFKNAGLVYGGGVQRLRHLLNGRQRTVTINRDRPSKCP
ncbi:uncharacterized protein LOC143195181 [Rhynchophorus ferrugineus]|uniref:uncharacterized protein LOC143195181 n=1 Tax=Rhynchophorus ferrugineus TaxID=354439 RepID=UPI003FCE9A2C